MLSRLIARLSFRRPPPVVGVIRLSGVIGQAGLLRGGMQLDSLAPSIERAFRLSGLKAIALAINSPGGSPAQSALIQQRIRDLAMEREVPVIATLNTSLRQELHFEVHGPILRRRPPPPLGD